MGKKAFTAILGKASVFLAAVAFATGVFASEAFAEGVEDAFPSPSDSSAGSPSGDLGSGGEGEAPAGGQGEPPVGGDGEAAGSPSDPPDAPTADGEGGAAPPADPPSPPRDGWVEVGGLRYYYEGGEPFEGPLFLGGSWYWLDPARGGAMATGVACIDGSWYRYGADGRMVTGWHSDGGRSYYYDPLDGTLTFRNRCVDGSWYWFDLAEGYMWTGPAYIDGAWYRYGADGRMLHGSQWLDGSWYRYDPADGRMLTGPQWIDGAWYFYDRMDGRMLMGSACIDGSWYRYDPVDGRIKHGWQSIEGSDYYYDTVDGKMYTGAHYIDGYWYYFHKMAGFLDYEGAMEQVMATAHSLLGVPYVWLGVYPQDGGMDCASFVWYVYRCLGVDIGFETYDQMYDGYRIDSLADARPGDIILMYYGSWPNYNPSLPEHVVLYAGNGMIYEEPDFGGHCQYVSLFSKGATKMEIRRIVRD